MGSEHSFELPAGSTLARGFQRAQDSPWPLVSFRDVFRLHYGKSLTEPNRIPGGVPVYGTNGPCGEHNEALFSGPGIVIGRKGQGPLGVEWVEQDYWVIDTAYSLELLTDTVELRFAYYLIDYVGLNHLKDGTSNPSLSRDTFGAQAFPLPSLSEQKRIAHILGTLDDKIELNRKMNRTFEAMTRAIFKSWFVDFDPVRAKMEGRQPSGLDPETAALFPDSLVDSELGPIPEGWEVKKLSQVARVFSGSTPSTKNKTYWEPAVHNWATPKDLSGMEMPILLDTERKVSDSGLEKVTNGIRPAGSLLMSKRAPIGYLAIARVPTAVNQGFLAMEFDGPVSNYWMLNWLYFNMELVKSRANGSTFKEISQSSFKGLLLAVPAQVAIKAFNDMVEPLYLKIELSLRESKCLEEQRNALLQTLLNGNP